MTKSGEENFWCKNRFFTYIFQKKTVKKKTKHLVFACFFKGLQMVELKNDEKNGVLPTINALKWFIKKQITKCRKSYLGYLCSVSTYPFVIFSATQPNRSLQVRTNSTRNRPPQYTLLYVLRWSVYVSKEPSIDKAYRRNSRCLLKFERNPPKQKTQWWR